MGKVGFEFGLKKTPGEKDWEKHWQDMPEYNNQDLPAPAMTATFKFKSREDFEAFQELLKKHIYGDVRIFDGNQKVDAKTTWYPLKERPGNFGYYEEEPK